ncbi:MAG: hypothetical protein KBD37_04535 [Burkholderiales bacterium]|nr:hypothetical protein [Burkholderiales bacterium]
MCSPLRLASVPPSALQNKFSSVITDVGNDSKLVLFGQQQVKFTAYKSRSGMLQCHAQLHQGNPMLTHKAKHEEYLEFIKKDIAESVSKYNVPEDKAKAVRTVKLMIKLAQESMNNGGNECSIDSNHYNGEIDYELFNSLAEKLKYNLSMICVHKNAPLVNTKLSFPGTNYTATVADLKKWIDDYEVTEKFRLLVDSVKGKAAIEIISYLVEYVALVQDGSLVSQQLHLNHLKEIWKSKYVINISCDDFCQLVVKSSKFFKASMSPHFKDFLMSVKKENPIIFHKIIDRCKFSYYKFLVTNGLIIPAQYTFRSVSALFTSNVKIMNYAQKIHYMFNSGGFAELLANKESPIVGRVNFEPGLNPAKTLLKFVDLVIKFAKQENSGIIEISHVNQDFYDKKDYSLVSLNQISIKFNGMVDVKAKLEELDQYLSEHIDVVKDGDIDTIIFSRDTRYNESKFISYYDDAQQVEI